MSTVTLPFTLPKPVSRKVRLLRWMVRLYVLVDGLAAVAVVLGVAFWLALAIDRLVEPTVEVRAFLWLLTLGTAGYVAIRYLLSPLGAKLSNTSLALLLERNHPSLRQSLITTIEAADPHRESPVGNAKLLELTSAESVSTLRGYKLRSLFQFRPLILKSTIALALAASIVAFASTQSAAFDFWLERMQLSEELWPRTVALSVVGFEEVDGRRFVNVARDDDYSLQVQASLRDGHKAPEQIEIRYRRADGRRGRDMMTRIGEAIPGRDNAQLFRYEFKKIAADLTFDLVGGDDRLRDLQLRIVERPQIFRMALECEFPAYLERAAQTIPVSGRVELPEGTQAICQLESNKPLIDVVVHDPTEQADLPTSVDTENDRLATFAVSVSDQDRVLLVTMHDQDGVSNREPYRVVLSVVRDEPPEVSVQLRGIGTAITPQATIPFAGQVSDDYALDAAWFEYQIDQQPPQQRPTEQQPNRSRELDDLGQLDLALTNSETQRPLVELQPGQQITLSVQARDRYNLNEQEHVGSSQRFMLDVVTESELRALLEKKELALRQRFESIYEKMTGTRELLDRIDVELTVKDTEDDTDEQAAAAAASSRERDRLRLSGALQNVVQLSYETLGVADGFDDIVGELINNRVDTEQLTQRLQQGIAEPLRNIGGQLMPELESRLQTLQSTFTQGEPSNQPLIAAKRQGDEVLDAMQAVLDRMLELESYNELVELLRGIVADQQKVQEETQQQRREKLRSLLDE